MEETTNIDAKQKALELMELPTAKLPELAIEYIKYLGQMYGLCSEVVLTALCHYLQIVEKVKCNEECYIADCRAVRFFKQKGIE